METELKFRLPDAQTFDRLLHVDTLAGVPVGPARLVSVHDRYVDTPSGTLMRAGYSCRLRETSADDRLVTIKSLDIAGDAMHVREEIEFRLDPEVPVNRVRQWPESRARDLVLALVQDELLGELFAFRQQRHQRLWPVEDHMVPQVEFSLDRVALGGPDDPMLLGLEAELLSGGTLALLTRLADELRDTWHLEAETRPKFWQALAAMRPDLASAVLPPPLM